MSRLEYGWSTTTAEQLAAFVLICALFALACLPLLRRFGATRVSLASSLTSPEGLLLVALDSIQGLFSVLYGGGLSRKMDWRSLRGFKGSQGATAGSAAGGTSWQELLQQVDEDSAQSSANGEYLRPKID